MGKWLNIGENDEVYTHGGHSCSCNAVYMFQLGIHMDEPFGRLRGHSDLPMQDPAA